MTSATQTKAFDSDYALIPDDPSRFKRISRQKRLLNQINQIGSKTVQVKCSTPSIYQVTFLGVEVGQIRPLNGGWGWRTKSKDHVCQDRQEAAQVFVDWLLRRHWSCYKHKFEMPAICEP